MSAEVPGEPTMGQALAMLWRGRFFVIACAAIAGAIGFAFAERRGVVRRAKAVLHVERAGPVVPDLDLARFREGRGFANAQAALLKSTPTLLRGLEALGDGPRSMFADVEDRLAYVRRALTVTAGAEDGLLTVTLDDADCRTACAFVNAVVDAYATRLAEAQQSTSRAALDAMRSELTQRRAEAAAAEAEHRRAIEAEPSLALDDEARRTATQAKIRELAGALAQAEARAVAAAAEAHAARACAESRDPLTTARIPGVGEAAQAALMERAHNVAAIAARRERLLASVTEEHPDLVRCSDELARERNASQAAARESALAAADAATSRSRTESEHAAALASRIRDMEQQLMREAPGLSRARALEAKAERARRGAAALEDRMHELGLANAATQTAAWPQSALVYERADPETSAVAQGRGSIVAAAAFAGFAVGLALIWLRALARPSVFVAADLHGLAGCAVEFPRVRRGKGARAAERRLLGPAHALATRLGKRCGAGHGGSVCVAGVVDDRATAAVGLAIATAFAQQGERVLLCDPFDLTDSESRRGAAGAAASDAESLRAVGTPGLWMLERASSLRSETHAWNGATQRALAQAAERFDRVVVLAPGVLRTMDAQLLAHICGAVVLVGAAGSLRIAEARDAASALAGAGGSIQAFALHGVRSRAARISAPACERASGDARRAKVAEHGHSAKAWSEERRGDGAMGARA